MNVLFLTVFLLFASSPSMLDENLIITENGQPVTQVNRKDFESIVGEEFINNDRFEQFAAKVNKLIERKPKNAKIDDHGSIIAEQPGYKLDTERFRQQFYSYYFSRNPRSFEAPTIPIHPKVDSELIANIRTKQIGNFTTYFSGRNKARVNNISLAIQAINNHVVFPDETFSFNKVVGKRTKEKGYLPAPVIIKGKIYQDFGGGICQVSSTLFNAVDAAGLQVAQRYSHSKRVPYVPRGRDAQVSWYGSDFRFKNNLNQPILIQAKLSGKSVVISIYSSDVINTF